VPLFETQELAETKVPPTPAFCEAFALLIPPPPPPPKPTLDPKIALVPESPIDVLPPLPPFPEDTAVVVE
jgi:hypothetical protein